MFELLQLKHDRTNLNVDSEENNCFKSNQIFHYTRCNTPKRETGWRGSSPRNCAYGQHSSFRRTVPAVTRRWQHCVQFDRPEIRSSDLPLERRTRYSSTNLPVIIKCNAVSRDNNNNTHKRIQIV